MSGEVVHEEADLAVAVHLPELREVLLELRDVHRLREQHEELLPFLLRNAREQRHRRLVGLGLVDIQVLSGQAVFRLRQGRLGEHGLINVDDPVSFLPELLQLSIKLLSLPLHLVLRLVVLLLLPRNFALLYFIPPVYFAE